MLSSLRLAGRDFFDLLSRRFGTAIAAYLVGMGVPADLANQLMLASCVLIGLLIDLAMQQATTPKAS